MRGIYRVFFRAEISAFTGITDIRSIVKPTAMKRLEILTYRMTIVFATRFTWIKTGGISANFSFQTLSEICAFGFVEVMKTRLFRISRITVDGLQLRFEAISRKLCSSASPISILHLSVKSRCFRLISFLLFVVVQDPSLFYLLCILCCNTLYVQSFPLCRGYCNIFLLGVAFTFAFDGIVLFFV